jgi:hypothetical protein
MLDLLQQIDLNYYRTARLLIVRAELEQLRQVSRFWSPASDLLREQPPFAESPPQSEALTSVRA